MKYMDYIKTARNIGHEAQAQGERYVAVVCETLRDEYELACVNTGCVYETRWVKSGLHNYPEKLREALQSELDNIIDADRVLLCFGYCGNSVFGLQTRNFELIMPKTDDCISLLLTPVSDDIKGNLPKASYFLTAGWLRGERSIYDEYTHAVARYGKKRGDRVMSVMLANYENLLLLDTGCFDMESAAAESSFIAKELGLRFDIFPASINYIEKLLTGPYSSDSFIITKPNSQVIPQ